LNTYALQKIAAGYGEESRTAAATTTRVRQARRERHAESLHDVAVGPADLGGPRGRRGLMAGPVPRPRESEETMTRRAA
jgi:hypothetical protein